MYRAEIEVAKPKPERIHLERAFYNKAEKCGLLSCATTVVATSEEMVGKSRQAQQGRTETSG